MGSWKLGRAFGINIYIHWTFLFIVAFVLIRNWFIGGESFAEFGVLLLLAGFGCVVLHELGHALMARRFGISTRDITLYPIGGVARLERMSEKPMEELCIALAGPAVNVIIAAILWIPALPSIHALASARAFPEMLQGHFALALFLVNVGLVGFNMIPAFPMDGGRVLRALLVTPLGRVNATRVAATLGIVFAGLFVLGAFLNPFLPVIAVFVFFAGQRELAAIKQQEFNRRTAPLDVIPVEGEILDVIPVNPDERFSGSVRDEQRRICVIWRNGRPIYSYRLD